MEDCHEEMQEGRSSTIQGGTLSDLLELRPTPEHSGLEPGAHRLLEGVWKRVLQKVCVPVHISANSRDNHLHIF